MSDFHVTVMSAEVTRSLDRVIDGVVVDLTEGHGGHTKAILDSTPPAVSVIGFDRDNSALKVARERLAGYGNRAILVHSAYDGIVDVLHGMGISRISGAVADLGLSSAQLASNRGFAVSDPDQLLDMRFDPTVGETASEVARSLSEKSLAEILKNYGDVPASNRLARVLRERAKAGRLETMGQFVDACNFVLGPRVRGMPSATLPAQALRIQVNHEFERLEKILEVVPELLVPGGRMIVISFHSGEDRRVKVAFRNLAGTGRFALVTKKAASPSPQEVYENRRSRSARMRIIERMEEV